MGQVGSHLSPLAEKIRQRSIERWGRSRVVEIVGADPNLIELLDRAERVAVFDEPVLICGESGVGKEQLALAIYLLGPRSQGPLVSVNCPQYREGNLTVSELFGHTRGSFTGAISDRKGCFETADGGVIFLDEVGDLHMSAQVMLLRALSNGEFQPLGSENRRRVNVRIIAATNRPLDKLTVTERFRNDLFFRLRYFLFNLPPLRDRGTDWRLLMDHFLERLYEEHRVRKRLSKASEDLLESYRWAGNVRELRSIATMGYAMSEGDLIEPSDFVSLLSEERRLGGRRGDDPYTRLVAGGRSFWTEVYDPFMARDLNRSQVRELIRRGLGETNGSYRLLLDLFNIPEDEYQKFMDFLRHQGLKP
jgi:Nif-specific regulatory protein